MKQGAGIFFWLLLMPFALWLLLLVFIPHIDMLSIALREQVAPREYAFSTANFSEFFNEPLYWRTFLRTALMSIMATALTLLVAFPVSYFIAKVMRGKSRSLLFPVVPDPILGQRTCQNLWLDDIAAGNRRHQ